MSEAKDAALEHYQAQLEALEEENARLAPVLRVAAQAAGFVVDEKPELRLVTE